MLKVYSAENTKLTDALGRESSNERSKQPYQLIIAVGTACAAS